MDIPQQETEIEMDRSTTVWKYVILRTASGGWRIGETSVLLLTVALTAAVRWCCLLELVGYIAEQSGKNISFPSLLLSS